MDHQSVGRSWNHQNKTSPFLTCPEEEATKCTAVAEEKSSLSFVGVEELLVGQGVGELLGDRALELLVPPGLEAAVVGVELARPLVLRTVDLEGLVREVGAQQHHCHHLQALLHNGNVACRHLDSLRWSVCLLLSHFGKWHVACLLDRR
eukprot:CAMPEP_0185600598 /NCGR_PEP_ID=MMETSP0436-20130131/529_1 /TAXON_ID=626734 ORGANISM="Favella taraikaensis, Strain Fe Narragansett Bay" /NCGR_SAMPLE_ID=MMETSP0436 /ASSEMBLY_ACC=CAM_ASM_000390 /LENGTH=148 /DNA_ID=CAMNT_0028230343 /DNA_START=305 /DNA_END=747 /DNA_ORIENTATION=-